MLFKTPGSRQNFVKLLLFLGACGLVFVLACSRGEEASPVAPDSDSASVKTGQTFNLFGPVEFFYQCDEEYPERDSTPNGDKILPMQMQERSIGRDVSLFSGDYSMSIWNGDRNGTSRLASQIEIYLDGQIVADKSSFVDNFAVIPLAAITDFSSLRVELAGECYCRVEILIEGTVANDVETIDTGGGNIAVEDPADPLYGISVNIPAGAVSEPTLFSVRLEENPPPALNPVLLPVGPCVDVHSSRSDNFFQPLEITFPISVPVGPNEFVFGSYYDETSESWKHVDSQISVDGQSITVDTDHLSTWLINSTGISEEMIAAMGQLDGLSFILQAVLGETDEADGQMRCSVLNDLRSQLSAAESTYGLSLHNFDSSQLTILWGDDCTDYFGANNDRVGSYARIWAIAFMRFATHPRFDSEWITLLANGSDYEASRELVRFILREYDNCLEYAFVGNNVGESAYVNLFGTMMASAGIGVIDHAISDFGCHENPIGEFVLVPSGTFNMGSPPAELGRDDDETQHQVTLTHDFFCQTTEVTNQQYVDTVQWAYDNGYVTVEEGNSVRDNLDGSTRELLDLNGFGSEVDFFDGVFTCDNPDHPAKTLSYYGAAAFCDWLSLKAGLPRAYSHVNWICNGNSPYTATGYRLPTEAEWEYACRGGSSTTFANGPITYIDCVPVDPNLAEMGWYCEDNGSHPVAQKMPNAFGLYDMHGNIFEWCNDRYESYGGTVVNPVGGPFQTGYGVARGGSWYNTSQNCRSGSRTKEYLINPGWTIGVRVVVRAN